MFKFFSIWNLNENLIETKMNYLLLNPFLTLFALIVSPLLITLYCRCRELCTSTQVTKQKRFAFCRLQVYLASSWRQVGVNSRSKVQRCEASKTRVEKKSWRDDWTTHYWWMTSSTESNIWDQSSNHLSQTKRRFLVINFFLNINLFLYNFC